MQRIFTSLQRLGIRLKNTMAYDLPVGLKTDIDTFTRRVGYEDLDEVDVAFVTLASSFINHSPKLFYHQSGVS
jgi:hypothetical protein